MYFWGIQSILRIILKDNLVCTWLRHSNYNYGDIYQLDSDICIVRNIYPWRLMCNTNPDMIYVFSYIFIYDFEYTIRLYLLLFFKFNIMYISMFIQKESSWRPQFYHKIKVQSLIIYILVIYRFKITSRDYIIYISFNNTII